MQKWARETALQMPAAELTHPFGPEWDVFKVVGKVFMLASRLPAHGARDVTAPGGTPIVVVKAEPGDVHALQRAYPFVFPGYHLNKKHWVTVVAPGEVTGQPAAGNPSADTATGAANGDPIGKATGDPIDQAEFARLLRELVTDSYRNVVLGLPRAKRPVDPMTFGATATDGVPGA